jgi:hypothetical protein
LRMRLSRVVLPLPRKPVRMVTGISDMLISFLILLLSYLLQETSEHRHF